MQLISLSFCLSRGKKGNLSNWKALRNNWSRWSASIQGCKTDKDSGGSYRNSQLPAWWKVLANPSRKRNIKSCHNIYGERLVLMRNSSALQMLVTPMPSLSINLAKENCEHDAWKGLTFRQLPISLTEVGLTVWRLGQLQSNARRRKVELICCSDSWIVSQRAAFPLFS